MAADVSLLRFRYAEQEYKTLTLSLESQLYWDILKIYSDSIFYDVEIQFETSSIKTHSSFLLLYAPHFYAELLRLKESRNLVFLDKAKEHVETFIRALYQPPKKCFKEKEAKLVERLQFFLKTSGDESQDLFLTPDSATSIEDKSDNDRSHLVPSYFSTNQLYYALITLDESYINDSGVEHLEKELTEQDQLSESLRLLRENRTTPLKLKSNQPVYNQKNFLKKGSRNKFLRLRSKSRNDEMSDSEKVCNKDCCFGEVMSKSTSKEASQSTIYSETSGIGSSERIGLLNDHDSDLSSVCNGTNFNENNVAVKNSVSQPYHQTSTSHFINVPNEVGKTDRSTPSTHDFETFVIDPTEKLPQNDTSVAFCDHIDGSSTIEKVNPDSVSDISLGNFPIDRKGLESKDDKCSPKAAKGDINERITSAYNFNRMCCSVNNSESKDDNIQGRVNHNRRQNHDLSNSALVESCSVFDCFDSRAWDVLNEEEREMMKSREYKTFLLKSFSDQISKRISRMEQKKHETTVCDSTAENGKINCKVSAQNQLQKCCEIQPNLSTVRTDELVSIYQDSLEASQKCSPDSDKIPKNETSASSSNNFFIDASSLLDETELSLPLSSLSFNVNQIETNYNQTLDYKVSQMSEFCNQKANSMESALETDSVSANDARQKITEPTSLTEAPRLIRQKTFELEPSEEKLAILRKEYEKQLGGKVFSDSKTSLEAQNGFSDMTALEMNSNDIKAELRPYCQNETLSLNSPDSLNNDDQPEENCSQKELIDDSLNTNFMLGKVGKGVEKKVSNCSDELSTSGPSHSFSKSAKDKKVNKFYSGNNNLCRGKGKNSKLNCLESIPIISGGIGVKDISNPISLGHSNNASPSMSRKIESSPIMSSGAVSIESEPKFRQKKVNPLNGESWVINLSDLSKSCNTSRLDDSEDASTPPRSAKSSSSGSSFFIDLNELPKEQDSNNFSSTPKAQNHVKLLKNSRKEFQKVLSLEKTKVDQNQQTRSCGFFVNLNDEPLPNSQSVAGKESNDNLFTMFIDLNNPSSESNSLEQPTKAALIKKRLQTQAEKFSLKQNGKSDSKNQSDSDYEHPEITKGKHLFSDFSAASSHTSSTSHFKLIKSESLSDSQSESTSTSQSKQLSETASLRVRSAPVKHKRTHSISIDKIQQQINRIPDVDKFSSAQKMVCSGPASLNTNPRKGKMTTSWHGANETRESIQVLVKLATVDDLQDIKLEKPEESLSISNHTDFSTSTSISEMGNSKNTFILDEEDIGKNPQLTYDLDTSATSHDNASDLSKDDNSSSDLSKTETNLKSSSDRGIRKTAVSQKADTNHSKVNGSFVKLSDMDKEPLKKSSGKRGVPNRMSRSIPEMSWIESKLQSKSATSRSLNRLFPQLSASINSRTSDYSDTDLSTISSMHSSLEPSVLESTEDSEQETKNCSQLGEDLLRMFLDEISPDVIVEVGGRRIKAHKCILSSRCQYFAAILSGGWVQSAGDVISLQGFSYSVVHFALCHIYSGASNIPDSISLVELATLADMLCLEGLKEVISYTLKLKYCHFFHKPCSICTVGVLECLTLAAAYGLDDLYRKCLRWINKYFTKLWITKPFASLPRELIDKCYKQLVAHITVECTLDMIINCKTLSDNIPSSRWAESLHELAKRLNDACVKYMSQHFAAIISSNKFAVLLKDSTVDRSLVQLHVLRAAELLSPDESCKSYSAINKLVSLNQSQEGIPDIHFIEFLNEIHTKVEEVLVKLARRAVKTVSWTLLDIDLRNKIQKRAGLVFIPGTDKSKLRSSNNRHESTNSRTMELHKVKLVINGESEETTSKAPNNSSSRPKTWPSQNFAQVKSRYLEQRPTRNNVRSTVSNAPEKKSTPLLQRRPAKIQSNKISSSDSSHTHSPAATRSVNNSTLSTRSSQRTPLSRQKDTHTQDSVELARPKPLSSRKPSLTQTKTPNTNVNSTRTHNMRVAARNAAKKNGLVPKIASSVTEKKSAMQSPMPSRKNTPRPINPNSSNAENKSPLKQRAKPQPKDKATASGLTVRQGNFSNSDNKVQKNIHEAKMSQNKPNSSKPDKQGSLRSSSRSGTFCKDDPSNIC